MFDFIGSILNLICILSLVTFIATGAYLVFGPKTQGAIQAKRTSRGMKFFGLALALVLLNVFLPMPLVGLFAIGADMVAYKRVRNVKYPLTAGGTYQGLPPGSTY